ncbi:amino acid adenylation domain-containing protein [Paraburkholderia sp. A2WS-5]|uniref:amino acid adenylation domain-containing protein n=1 Tax=unclassified Paraburkholderia TaxID=2615204 RepID=UPI003B794D2E
MLHAFFFDAAASQPHMPALWARGCTYHYGEIQAWARRVSSGLHAAGGTNDVRRCLLFGHRSAAAYAGILGILDAGLAYVPLSTRMPARRIAAIIEESGAPLMLVDRHGARALEEVLPLLAQPPRIFLLDEDAHDLSLPLLPSAPYVQRKSAESDVAYVLFTSGSTGTPKGVPITHANVSAYINGQLRIHGKSDDARYIQLCELVFDPSVHDMFVCWANGACLYVPETVDPLYNADFIKRHGITHWNSVSSVAGFMQQMRKLTADAFPSLRVSLFGGEPLARSLAQDWMRAAPHSRLLHMYGPTEATIACTYFEVDAGFVEDRRHAVVPLGGALPDVEWVIVDDELDPVANGQKGELLVAGPQIAEGYLSPDEAGNSRFVVGRYPGRRAQRWYRTGDAVRITEQYGLVFEGRLDSQVKIRGNRIELEEVERVVQTCSQAAQCAVIPWPVDEAGQAAGLVAFVTDASGEPGQIQRACRERLPLHAVPQRIEVLDALPLNVNGKIDRSALARQYAGDTMAV